MKIGQTVSYNQAITNNNFKAKNTTSFKGKMPSIDLDISLINNLADKYRNMPDGYKRVIEKKLVDNGLPLEQTLMVITNLKLAVAFASKSRAPIPLTERMGWACKGLIEAAKSYEPEKASFSTHAFNLMRKEINRAAEETGRAIRIPSCKQLDLQKLLKAENRLTHKLQRQPNAEELAAEMKMSVEKVETIMEAKRPDFDSFDRNILDEGSSTLADIIPDTTIPRPDDLLEQDDFRNIMAKTLQKLDPRERTVIESRLGMNDDTPLVLKAIGEKMGLSREGTRVLEGKGMKHFERQRRELREYMDNF